MKILNKASILPSGFTNTNLIKTALKSKIYKYNYVRISNVNLLKIKIYEVMKITFIPNDEIGSLEIKMQLTIYSKTIAITDFKTISS